MSLPSLSAALVENRLQGHPDLRVPTPAMLNLPERAIQFGTGAFLRGFVGDFLDDANHRGAFSGRLVAIGSTGSGREQAITDQDGLYTLVIRGVERGEPVERRRLVGSMSRALTASADWQSVLACARNPDLAIVFSNTTEVGIALDEEDAFAASPPRSFPGKLTRFLYERAKTFDFAADKGLIILPCELLESNGDKLRDIVRTLAKRWSLEAAFAKWLEGSVRFCNTLVDRIVPGTPSVTESASLADSLGYRDELLTACEPYRLFAIEGDAALRTRLGFADQQAGVIVTGDIAPYRERKVRLLNGAHTIMVPAALLAGCETVLDAMRHEAVGAFVRRALLDEIVPSLDAEGAADFARETLDRFANPHIRHELFDITLQGTTKMKVRVVPSIVAYSDRTGKVPGALALGFAAWLQFMRGDLHAKRQVAGRGIPEDAAGVAIRALWTAAPSTPTALAAIVRRACGNSALWQTDLNELPGFAEAVTEHLLRIERSGVVSAIEALAAAGAAA